MNRHAPWIRAFLAAAACVVAFIGAVPVHAQDEGDRPNILVIFGDIGMADNSVYSHGDDAKRALASS
jgi:hypothetical protein